MRCQTVRAKKSQEPGGGDQPNPWLPFKVRRVEPAGFEPAIREEERPARNKWQAISDRTLAGQASGSFLADLVKGDPLAERVAVHPHDGRGADYIAVVFLQGFFDEVLFKLR